MGRLLGLIKGCIDVLVQTSAFCEYVGRGNPRELEFGLILQTVFDILKFHRMGPHSPRMHALFLALDHVETDSSHNFIIFSNSKSTLESLRSKDWTNPLVLKILETHNYSCTVCDRVIIHCWVPSHIGIQGN